MQSLRSYFRTIEAGARFRSYISPIINLFKTGDSPAPPTEKILTKELDYRSGLESPLENPDSLLENKSKNLTFYDTMMSDDKIKSCIDLKKRLVLSSNGDVIPASDEQADIDIAAFCRWQFDNMHISFNDILDNYLDAMVFGNKNGEIMWQNSVSAEKLNKAVPDEYVGKWWVGNIKHKHSVFFDYKYNDYGTIEELLIGRNYGSDISIPAAEIAKKFLIFTYPYPKDGNYYGESDLKEIYPQWYAKFNIFRFRNQYLERYGMPIPEVIYDQKRTTSSEVNELRLIMKNLQESSYLINPGTFDKESGKIIGKFDVKFHEARKGTATDQYENAINQIDKQIARKLLIPDKIGFAETGTGSYAQSETELKIFISVIEDLQRKLEKLVNELIVKIVDFNYPNIKEYPRWQFDKLSKVIEQEMLKALIDTGVVDKREKWIRKYTGIPELSEKEQEDIDEKVKEDIRNAPKLPPMPPNQDDDEEEEVKKKKFKKSKSPVNDTSIQRNYNEAEAEFLMRYNEVWVDNTKYIINQVENKKIIQTGDIKKLDTIKIKKTDLKRLFREYYTRLFVAGKIDAIEEIKPRYEKVKKTGFQSDFVEMEIAEYGDRDYIKNLLAGYGELGKLDANDVREFKLISDNAYLNAGLTEEEMVKIATRTVTTGLRNGTPMQGIISNIANNLKDEYKQYATTVARTSASDYYNTGRMNLFTNKNIDPYTEAYEYIAILDDVTTLFCESHDGQIIAKNDPLVSHINPPNHFNCRSMLSVIFVGESADPDSYYYDYENTKKAWGTGVPVANRNPAKGFS